MNRKLIFGISLIAIFILVRQLFSTSEKNVDEKGLVAQKSSHFYNVIHHNELQIRNRVNKVNFQTSTFKTGEVVSTSAYLDPVFQDIDHIGEEKSQIFLDNTNLSIFQFLSTNLSYIAKLQNVHIVKTTFVYVFLNRTERFCKAIGRLRELILSARGLKPWKDVESPDNLKVLWGKDDDFLGKLALERNLTIILLPWKKYNQSGANTIVKDYYHWTASHLLCEWIRTPRLTRAHWDAVYNRECKEDIEAHRGLRKLEPMYFYGKPINQLHYWPKDGLHYPSYFYKRYPFVPLYLTIVQDAIVNVVGDVISGRLKIVPYTCSHDSIPTIPNEYRESPIYSEVFVVTQFWGNSYFHRMVEVMPRLAPYLSFLKYNPGIKIHAPEEEGLTREMIELLGLNGERLVTGVVRAKIAYLPQGTPCGFPHVQSFQLLSHHLRAQVARRPRRQDDAVSRDALVLIERSGSRRLLNGHLLEVLLRDFSAKNNLDFHVFSDKRIPGLEETMSIFGSARVVVAPHGAGLANVIFSDPGTLVIEGVCNPPHVNMCFQFVAHVLGHRYHGIPSRNGCESYINAEPQEFLRVLNKYVASGVLKVDNIDSF